MNGTSDTVFFKGISTPSMVNISFSKSLTALTANTICLTILALPVSKSPLLAIPPVAFTLLNTLTIEFLLMLVLVVFNVNVGALFAFDVVAFESLRLDIDMSTTFNDIPLNGGLTAVITGASIVLKITPFMVRSIVENALVPPLIDASAKPPFIPVV